MEEKLYKIQGSVLWAFVVICLLAIFGETFIIRPLGGTLLIMLAWTFWGNWKCLF